MGQVWQVQNFIDWDFFKGKDKEGAVDVLALGHN